MEAPVDENELDPDAIRERHLQYAREYSRNYYWSHREKELARTRKYAIENKEIIAYKKKLWYLRKKESNGGNGKDDQ